MDIPSNVIDFFLYIYKALTFWRVASLYAASTLRTSETRRKGEPVSRYKARSLCASFLSQVSPTTKLFRSISSPQIPRQKLFSVPSQRVFELKIEKEFSTNHLQ